MLSEEIRQFFINRILGLRNETISQKEMESIIFPKKDHKIVKVLGMGSNGLVFNVRCIKTREHFAVKVIGITKDEETTLDEFNFQNHLAKYTMAPKIYNVQMIDCIFKNNKVRFVLGKMDIIHSTVNEYLEFGGDPEQLIPALECLIKKKLILQFNLNGNKKENMMHGDMHIGNLIILADKKTLGFLDFGFSRLKPSIFQILDAIPLIGSIKYDRRHYDKKKFAENLIQIYNDMFNIDMSYEKFKQHPSGGYMYVTSQEKPLHSYDWIENIAHMRFGLPTANDIRRGFPGLNLPKII